MHKIEKYELDDGIIGHRQAKMYLVRSMLIFMVSSFAFIFGGFVIGDHLTSWPTTCQGHPIPGSFLLLGIVVFVGGGWFVVRRGLSIVNVLDPFINGKRLGVVSPARSTSTLNEAAATFNETVSRREPKQESKQEQPRVVDGNWVRESEMPA